MPSPVSTCALAGMLALRHADVDGDFSFRIAQGVEMGRPSVLDARAEQTRRQGHRNLDRRLQCYGR